MSAELRFACRCIGAVLDEAHEALDEADWRRFVRRVTSVIARENLRLALAAGGDEALLAAAGYRIRSGRYEGRTLAEIADQENGEAWFAYHLRRHPRSNHGDDFHTVVATYARARLPELWARYEADASGGIP
jgi:hypothetical protein